MNSNTIVILGGGVGGLVTANALRQRLVGEHSIVLVEKQVNHTSPQALFDGEGFCA